MSNSYMCSISRCPNTLPKAGRCNNHKRLTQAFNKMMKPRNPLYGTTRWQVLRLHILQENPLCVACGGGGGTPQTGTWSGGDGGLGAGGGGTARSGNGSLAGAGGSAGANTGGGGGGGASAKWSTLPSGSTGGAGGAGGSGYVAFIY